MNVCQHIPERLAQELLRLADEFETEAFLKNDPAQFMHCYREARDKEIIAFLAAQLAFGKREQILRHIEKICYNIEETAHNSPFLWIAQGHYKDFFCGGEQSFYRMFSHKVLFILCANLERAIAAHGSLQEAVFYAYKHAKSTRAHGEDILLHTCIASLFDKECAIISRGNGSAAKRLQMFLRWMVRDHSPVDLGLWSGWYPKAKLLIPLDTHVLQEACALGILGYTKSGKPPAASLRLCQELTRALGTVFTGDPARADFALFGLGISKQ